MRPIKDDFRHIYRCFPDINLDLIENIIGILKNGNEYDVQIRDKYSEYDSIDDVIKNKGKEINHILLTARSKDINSFICIGLGSGVFLSAEESDEFIFYKLKNELEDFLKKNRFNKIIKIISPMAKIVCISLLCFIIIKLFFGE